LGLAFLIGAAYSAYIGLKEVGNGLLWALGLVYSIPITSIYAVTIHSLPNTYQSKPRRGLVLALYTLQALGVALYATNTRLGVAILAASLLLYPFAARFELLRRGLERAEKLKGAARRGHLYYVWGHITVLIIIAAALAASAYYISSQNYTSFILLVHTLTLGFVACHIAIHAPLMVPIILNVRNSRRYNPTPYILILAALAAYPFNETVSLAIFSAAVLATLLII
jgi:hypothetical protein